MKIYMVKTPTDLLFLSADELRKLQGPGQVVQVVEAPDAVEENA